MKRLQKLQPSYYNPPIYWAHPTTQYAKFCNPKNPQNMSYDSKRMSISTWKGWHFRGKRWYILVQMPQIKKLLSDSCSATRKPLETLFLKISRRGSNDDINFRIDIHYDIHFRIDQLNNKDEYEYKNLEPKKVHKDWKSTNTSIGLCILNTNFLSEHSLKFTMIARG